MLSNIDKVFEKLVYSRVISFFNTNHVLFKRQYGFRSKHSTAHSLINITERIRQSLDKGEYSCGILIDFKKAFDTVDHLILLKKLDHYGIRGTPNNWFRSYLCDRKQYVSGTNSSFKSINHGEPQGSVLRPLLFLIYINDLPNALVYSDAFIFADDTALLYSDKNLKRIRKRLNIDLKLLVHWLHTNKIGLIVDKTEAILFRSAKKKVDYDLKLKLNGKKFQLVSPVRYLGIVLDENLSWTHHKNSLAGKLRKSNGALSKLRHYIPRATIVSIYFSLFHSHLSYGIQVWGQNINENCRIIKLQKTVIRLITFSDFRAHSTSLFLLLDIPSIQNLVFVLNVCLVHQAWNFECPDSIREILSLSVIQSQYETRGALMKLLKRPVAKSTKYGLNSITYQSVINWNQLQINNPTIDLSSISYLKTKKIVKNFVKVALPRLATSY